MKCLHRGSVIQIRKADNLPDLPIYRCNAHDRCVETKAGFDRLGGAAVHVCEGCSDVKEPPKSDKVFDRVVIINLERRPDRLEQIRAEIAKGWPFVEPTVMKAIDGHRCEAPDGYSQGNYAWACFQSHRRAIEDAVNDGLESILILEDDATFVDDFSTKAIQFVESLPDDWQFAWLGGHHMRPPIPIKPGVVKSVHMDRCHAYAARGQGLRDLYRFWHQWHPGHCDWALSEWVASRPSYCAQPWLVGQVGGWSDIHWSTKSPEWWHENVPQADPISRKDQEMLNRVQFNLEAYPCRFRNEFRRIEKRDGSCALTDAPCFGCSLPSNKTGEASLWQFCTTQEMPHCNRCSDRRDHDPNDRLVDISGLENIFQRPAQIGPFGGMPLQRRVPVSGVR